MLANALLLPALLALFGAPREREGRARGWRLAPEHATLMVCWVGQALGLGLFGAAPLLRGLPARWHAPFVVTVVGNVLNTCARLNTPLLRARVVIVRLGSVCMMCSAGPFLVLLDARY